MPKMSPEARKEFLEKHGVRPKEEIKETIDTIDDLKCADKLPLSCAENLTEALEWAMGETGPLVYKEEP
jgi:hypothetical protein